MCLRKIEPSLQRVCKKVRTGYLSLDLITCRLLVNFTRDVSMEYWGKTTIVVQEEKIERGTRERNYGQNYQNKL